MSLYCCDGDWARPEDMVERVARAVRRNRFIRTRRIASFDGTVPPTDEELDDARAAIDAMREPPQEMLDAATSKSEERMISMQALDWLASGPVPRRTEGRWLRATEISPPVWYPPESEEFYLKVKKEFERLKKRRERS